MNLGVSSKGHSTNVTAPITESATKTPGPAPSAAKPASKWLEKIDDKAFLQKIGVMPSSTNLGAGGFYGPCDPNDPYDRKIIEAKAKVENVKCQLDSYVDQFFEENLDKVKVREEWIINSKFEPRLKESQRKLERIQHKVKEQQ